MCPCLETLTACHWNCTPSNPRITSYNVCYTKLLRDDEDWPNVPIGFNFNFNGTVFDHVSIQTNGYVVMGPTIGGYNYQNPICCGSNDNLVCGLFLDLQAQPGSEIMSKTEGTAPNRVFVVQWTNYRNYGATPGLDNFNFQIRP